MNRKLWLALALVPVLLPACWLATWREQQIWRVSFSPDGKLLATVGNVFVPNSHQPRLFVPNSYLPRLPNGEVSIWDAATGRRLRSRRQTSALTSLAFSPDGKTLATGDAEGTIAFWDVATLEPAGRSWRVAQTSATSNPWEYLTPWTVTFLAFTADGRTLILADQDNLVGLWDVASGRQTDIAANNVALRPAADALAPRAERQMDIAANNVALAPTQDGGRLAVSAHGGANTIMKLYDISQQRFRLTESVTTTYWLAISPDGKQVVVSSPTGIHLWDREARRVVYTFKACTCSSAVFSGDGRLAAVSGGPNTLEVVEARSGLPIAAAATTEDVWSLEFSPNAGRLAAVFSHEHVSNQKFREVGFGGWLPRFFSDGPGVVHVFDATTLREHCRLPDDTLVFWLFAGTIVSFLAWCAAWIRAGLGRRRALQPALDVALIGGIVLAVLLLRIVGTRAEEGFAQPEMAIALGLIAALVTPIVGWAVLGQLRWPLRIAAAIAALAAGWMISFSLWEQSWQQSWQQWAIVVTTATMLAGMLPLLKTLRARGWSVVGPAGRADCSAGARQFRIKDLALWTAAIALLMAVARHVTVEPMTERHFVFLFVTATELAAVMMAAHWSGLADARLRRRLAVLAGVTLLGGSVHAVCFRSSVPEPWWWFSLLNASLAGFTFGALGVFRLHGYRLRREAPAASDEHPAPGGATPRHAERTP